MATTTKRIQRIQGPISALNAGQIGVENTVDADLGFKMHGGKDGDGAVTKWLAKDKPARVSEMTVLDLGAGAVVSDAGGRLSVSVIPGFQDLQSVMETGSTAEIDTDYELEIEQNAPLSGTANPIYGRERIRNTGAESGSPKASQWRRRAEGNSGNSYAESNQTASESTGGDDYISDIAAVDGWTARVRCRVKDGVATITENAQTKTVTLAGDQTVTLENDVLKGAVTDTETVKNIGLGATTGDVSYARKVIIAEADNDTAGDLGTPGRLTLTVEAQNTAGYAGDSALNVEAFDGLTEKKITETGIAGGSTYHKIVADIINLNGVDPLGVLTVASETDTVGQMTAMDAPLTVITGSASGYIRRTPNASAMPVGWTRTIKNMSSEFVIIDNGAGGTLFVLLGPDCDCTITLKTASAAGTWSAIKNNSGIVENIYEFTGNQNTVDYQGWNPSNGTGASQDIYGTTTNVGCVGLYEQLTGTSSSTAQSVTRRGIVTLNRGPFLLEWKNLIATQATAAEDFGAEFGFISTMTALEATNGVVLRMPTQASGKTTWTGYTFASSTGTTIDSTVVYSGSTYAEAVILINSAGTRADFWINKVYAGKSTTNIPNTTNLAPYFGIIKTNGTGSRSVRTDTVRYSYAKARG